MSEPPEGRARSTDPPSGEAPLRVLVVADSPVVRAGLVAVLAEDAGLLVVGRTTTAAVGVAVARHRPDVVLVAREPGETTGTGLDEDSPAPEHPAVVVMRELEDDAGGHTAVDALRAGARAVLPRDAAPAALRAALRAVAAGLVVLPAESLVATLSRASMSATAEEVRAEGGPALTPREVEVLAMLAEGVGNKRIAARLAISEHTVKFHLASIYAKLGASTRTEAVMAGARRGLVML